MPVIDQFFRMVEEKLPLLFPGLRAVVPGVAAGHRVAALHGIDKSAVTDLSGESAVALTPEFSIPALSAAAKPRIGYGSRSMASTWLRPGKKQAGRREPGRRDRGRLQAF